MRKFEAASKLDLDLDLRPPVRLDLWALVLAMGIAAGTLAPLFAPALIAVSIVFAAGAAYWKTLLPGEWRTMALMAPLFMFAGVGIAYLHASAYDPLAELAALEPGEVTLLGKIASPPVQAGMGYKADLQVEHLWLKGEEMLRGGGVQVYAPDLRAGVGDRVVVEGRISVPSSKGGFDYARYLKSKRISAVVYATNTGPADEEQGWIGEVHRRTDVALSYGLRSREASIVRGMVLGDQSRIPEEVEDAFRRSGITHILAISGQHVAVLSAMIYFALRAMAIPIILRSSITLGLVWVYVIIAGAPPSAIRAAVVAVLVLLAPLLGRGLTPLHFMTTMLAVVLAWNPMLIYSAGFQLSVAAVFGILLLRRPLQTFIKNTLFRPLGDSHKWLSNLLAISLSAQIAITPIIASSFGEVSVIGALTNLVAVPVSGPVLTLGLLAALTGNLWPVLAYPINLSNGFLVTILEWVAAAASSLPFATIKAHNLSVPLTVIFYLGCIPAAISGYVVPEERWIWTGGGLVLWVILWLALVGV